MTPDGKSAYLTSIDDNTVSQYDIDPSSGALSPKTPATVTTGTAPVGVAVTPDGRNAYVGNQDDNTLSQYNIDPSSGALFPKTPASVAMGGGLFPTGVGVTPDGKSVYVVNSGGVLAASNVFQFNIDPLTGALAPKTPATVAAGTNAREVAVTPDGKSAYVTNDLDKTVSQYDVDPSSGALSAKTPATVATGSSPFGVAVTPDGRSAYVTNGLDSTVTQYNINPSTGALSPKTPATVATGTGPNGIAVRPPPRVPTSKDQCKNGGWRNFPGFKNQGQCVAFVDNQARQACLAERATIGRPAFRAKYGEGPQHRNALRRCIRRAAGG